MPWRQIVRPPTTTATDHRHQVLQAPDELTDLPRGARALGAEDDAPELLRPDVAEATLRALVDAWTPDWATVSSYAVRKAQAAPPRSPVLGWMTVVRRTTRVADLPVEGEYSVLRLPGGPTSVTADAVTTARAKFTDLVQPFVFEPAG